MIKLITEYNVELISDMLAGMYIHSGVTRRGKVRDRQYKDKIIKWLNDAPALIASTIYPHKLKGSHITTYHLPVNKLRNTLKLGRSDKGGEWFDFFKKHYPHYHVLQKGASVDGYRVCSQAAINNELCVEKFIKIDANKLDYNYLMDKRAKGRTSDVQVDISSLSNYIDNNKLSEVELRDANKILKFSQWLQVNDNQQDTKYTRIPQHYLQASNGRYFSRGPVTVSNCSANVREAMLGSCYEVDLEAAVFGYYRETIEQLKGFEDGIDPCYIDDYLKNKQSIRATIAKDCNISISQVKQALTSMTFGAKINTTAYSSLKTLIKNEYNRSLFVNHEMIKGLLVTIKHINTAIRVRDASKIAKLMVKSADEWVNVTEKGNRVFRINSYLAYLYTQWETKVMISLLKFIDRDNETLLWIHDGLYCRNKPNEDSINEFLKQYSNWTKCSVTKIR
jgi:hypothetical protein